MWHYRYIDTQLKFRLNALAEIKIEEHPLSGGNFTQTYKYNGLKILSYNYRKNGILMGNFLISPLVEMIPGMQLILRDAGTVVPGVSDLYLINAVIMIWKNLIISLNCCIRWCWEWNEFTLNLKSRF